MTPLELKHKKVELLRVTAARAELELRVDEALDNIERLKTHIKTQLDKEDELTKLIHEASHK